MLQVQRALLPLALWSACVTASDLDSQLTQVLGAANFTGRVGQSLEARLSRPIDKQLADLGRQLWFDKIGALHSDNSCSGCHSPTNGFGDSQAMAIGIQNNNKVGPHRTGPRNQRRTPMAVNVAFFPKLMWNGRFNAPSGDPFDNSKGFLFPEPEGSTRFAPGDKLHYHLLTAQAEMPPTELTEVAGYTGTKGTIDPLFDQFDDGKGTPLPAPDSTGFRNEPIRQEVLKRLNASAAYRKLFGQSFPEVAKGAPIDFTMFGRAIAEFEFTLVYADAPLDRFARGHPSAMTDSEKRGALVFFGKGGCVQCHAVAGQANEMFSDFQNHVAGVPQIAPMFGVDKGNVVFDGVTEDEDFGAEQVSNVEADRYKFRTSPLRNLALQPAYFHNGAFRRLDDAVLFHLNAAERILWYDSREAGAPQDLRYRLGPSDPMIARLDPLLKKPVSLTDEEFHDMVEFLRTGLLDHRARPAKLCSLVPVSLPSGMTLAEFEGCAKQQ